MSQVVTQILLGEDPKSHIEYIKNLENIIANLKNEVNHKNKENEELKKENQSLRKIIKHLDSSKLEKLEPKEDSGFENPNPTEENEEELDSFILAEKTAVNEIMKDPLQNPIKEILNLKSKGRF